jgi:hypothetical protein
MQNAELILSLIKDDLINSKLVNSLNKLGLHADAYFLHLSESIFKMLGFTEGEASEQVFERYMQLAEEALEIDITYSNKAMDALALKIYTELLVQKACL